MGTFHDRTKPFDLAEGLDTPEQIATFFTAALEDGDPDLISAAFGIIVRAKGFSLLAEETGLAREHLDASLSEKANPRLDVFLKVVSALGLGLAAVPKTHRVKAGRHSS